MFNCVIPRANQIASQSVFLMVFSLHPGNNIFVVNKTKNKAKIKTLTLKDIIMPGIVQLADHSLVKSNYHIILHVHKAASNYVTNYE